jgi:hypothetical protein
MLQMLKLRQLLDVNGFAASVAEVGFDECCTQLS